jgi:hypothetical protein
MEKMKSWKEVDVVTGGNLSQWMMLHPYAGIHAINGKIWHRECF